MRPVAFLMAALSVLGVAPLTAQTTFTVTSTADPGDGVCDAVCTLREAINAANATVGADIIAFSIAGTGPHTIAPGSALPTISDPLVIDGYTQSGASGNTNPVGQAINATLMIVLDGSGAGGVSGLTITAAGCTVRGLVINQFGGHGIHISGAGASGNLVEGNFIGTDANGTTDLGNVDDGVFIESGPTNTVGGTTAASRNLVSGNGLKGIDISNSTASGNVVQGNYIGTDVNGTAAIANDEHGISIDGAPNNTIGGTAAGAGNVVSGNAGDGIEIIFGNATGNVIRGNYIGTDASGAVALGNNRGVHFSEVTGNTLGGAAPGAGNVISGNASTAVRIGATNAANNLVQGNLIGTDASGTVALGNGTGSGVFVWLGHDNTIGGNVAGARNVVSGNANGITVSGTDNIVQGNYVGTDVTGTADLGNTGHGIRILRGTTGTLIGGTASGAGNVVSGNDQSGIHIAILVGLSPSASTVQGNAIGLDATGSALGNTEHGILIEDAFDNLIGGTGSGEANSIAHNGGDGVRVATGTGNQVLSNAIFSNTGLGIDLGGDGVTDNDAGDGDAGPNSLQNFPVFDVHLGSTIIAGAFNGAASAPFTLQFFSNSACDGSGNGQGETLLSTIAVTTDANGDATYADTLGASLAKATAIAGTATDANGNTSEFSECAGVADFNLAVSPSSASVTGGQSATYTVTVSPDGGSFGGSVSLACSGLPTGGSCDFTPSEVTPGATAATSTMTVSTVAATLRPIVPRWDTGPRGMLVVALLCVALLGLGLSLVPRTRTWRPRWVLVGGASLAFALFLGACGGEEPAGPMGPSPQTHTITVTGTAGSLEHSATVTLTVQ